ncbi:MAG: 30S ribosome-binding factor RbfA [Clostridiales bacterium]|nr:30S ribosome-binding factor RbfA [Clostridiales bacterium]
MANSKRMSRVDAEIQKALASIISKFDDIDFATSLISVMKVETTADFSFAKVYVSVLGEKEKKTRIVKKLNDNKKTIRYDLAHSLKMRNVPELSFIVDEVEEKAERILKLFEKIETELPPETNEETENED